MNMDFLRKLPTPAEVKDMYPITDEMAAKRNENVKVIKDIIAGRDDRLMLVIGPCSADRSDAVLDYISRLREVQEKVAEKIVIVPRIYTNKPRTTGDGYKGMLHQPNPNEKPDLLRGIISIRQLHMDALVKTGFSCADEMLYPENHRYLSDLIGYVAIGARSVENQQHRLTASGLDVPVGMKNPTSGDFSVMMNSVTAAQHSHSFLYRGWEVVSHGNEYAHTILRGYVDKKGNAHPNYHYEDIVTVSELYSKTDLKNPAIIVDCNHSNSGKKYEEQIRIAKEIVGVSKYNPEAGKLIKGLMIESYIEDGNQKPEGCVYGKSITDPCLGWEKTERLIYDLAEMR